MLVFVSLLAMLGTSQSLAFVPLTNTILLLGAPMLPKWWVKILTYLQSERVLFIIFHNFVLKLLIIFKALVLNPYIHVLGSFSYVFCVFLFILIFVCLLLRINVFLLPC
jgi:hypothetical protein